MPFGNVNVPALGITLLKGNLEREGLSCDIRYLQIPFSAQLGLDLYDAISGCFASLLLGDWLFAHLLFDEQLPDDEDYFGTILRRYVSAHGRTLPEDFIAQLPRVRELTGPYLARCMETIPWGQYNLIGFTSTFAQNLASLALAKRIKAAWPEKTIVFGGANCEGVMGVELHRQFPFVDYVCSGESDWLFPELVRRLGTGLDVSDLDGLIYRQNGDTVANGSHAQPVFDLDALPMPDYDDYFTQLEESGLEIPSEQLRLMMETGRGCWWGAKSQCIFCGMNSQTLKFRSKSSQRVLDEFVYLARRYPDTKTITVTDNILDIHYFQDVIPGLIKLDLGLSIWYEVKANLRKEQLRLLKQAGIQTIQPGIESLDSEILQLMHKGCNVIQNIQILKWAREFEIYVSWNLLSGFPGEDPTAYQRMAELIPLISHLQPPTSRGISTLRLDRFSPYFQNPEALGLVNIRPAAAYRYVYPFPKESLSRLAYYFDFDYADSRHPDDYTHLLDQAVRNWYDQAGKGSLLSMTGNGRLTLYDTRPHARQRETILDGMAKAIYEYCDEGRTLASILRHLKERGVLLEAQTEPNEMDAILKSLVDARLMLHVDDRYLSLAIPMSEHKMAFVDRFISSLSPVQEKLPGQGESEYG